MLGKYPGDVLHTSVVPDRLMVVLFLAALMLKRVDRGGRHRCWSKTPRFGVQKDAKLSSD